MLTNIFSLKIILRLQYVSCFSLIYYKLFSVILLMLKYQVMLRDNNASVEKLEGFPSTF